jgi:hypothetical protein
VEFHTFSKNGGKEVLTKEIIINLTSSSAMENQFDKILVDKMFKKELSNIIMGPIIKHQKKRYFRIPKL